ncbi:hypothetical protein KY41_03320 [Latilactobacillus sakei]|uniref:hypothetical protein n=1 Tax=Latilactobacillus sakei TaxID=1599 RepID=UPI000506BA80|nr:hypothetical protein KY41_03320 [Latilactobacillus sakei]
MSKEIQLHGGTITSFVDYNELLENFTCGNADMDVFLKEKAVGLTNSSETGTSGFFNDEDELVGFYSLSAAKIEIQNGYDSKTFANLSESAAYLASNVSYPAIKLDFLQLMKNINESTTVPPC